MNNGILYTTDCILFNIKLIYLSADKSTQLLPRTEFGVHESAHYLILYYTMKMKYF